MTTMGWFLLARDYAHQYGLPFWRSSEQLEVVNMLKNPFKKVL